jgi:hypothetical protein
MFQKYSKELAELSNATLEPAQCAQLVTKDRVCRWRSLLNPADRQVGRVEVDLVPAQMYQLRDPKPMPIRHKDHGGVAVAVALGSIISLATSASVRYSRERSSAFGRRLGVTVRFSVVGSTSRRCDFPMTISSPCKSIVRIMV